jgi:cytochrome d ubiquinol oxidase subunit I
VHGLLKTENAVSPTLSVGMVLISLIGFVLIYAVLMAVDVFLLVKYGKAGPDADVQESVDVAPSVVGAQD